MDKYQILRIRAAKETIVSIDKSGNIIGSSWQSLDFVVADYFGGRSSPDKKVPVHPIGKKDELDAMIVNYAGANYFVNNRNGGNALSVLEASALKYCLEQEQQPQLLYQSTPMVVPSFAGNTSDPFQAMYGTNRISTPVICECSKVLHEKEIVQYHKIQPPLPVYGLDLNGYAPNSAALKHPIAPLKNSPYSLN